ncbi:hypothetical protein [Pedobacter psychrodurus]|uniref:hypothetical protein n=1 Tax=Pedobacter psychrodurus TaxID=2530456 RepID=UPI0029313BDD|nr:hypothetical protein [Pedobacter psychrodurus]
MQRTEFINSPGLGIAQACTQTCFSARGKKAVHRNPADQWWRCSFWNCAWCRTQLPFINHRNFYYDKQQFTGMASKRD